MTTLTHATPANTAATPALTCFHCHDECADAHLHIGEKVFCCEGCQMVYEILNTNDLCDYYTLADRPGLSLRQRRDARAYAWLDDPEVAAQLLRFSRPDASRVVFNLPAVHCTSCIWLLEHLYRLDDGVTASRVDFLRKTVTINFHPEKTTLRRLAGLLSTLGYPPDIRLNDTTGSAPRPVSRTLYYQIAVAGFAVGNVMLFSFPEYLGMDGLQDASWRRIFGYLSLLIATPVLVFSARDYFISAWQGIKQRHLNIDVPLAAAFVAVFGRSVWEIATGTGAGYLDSFTGLVFFLLIGRWFQQKTWHHLSFERDYRSYFPVAANVRQTDGSEVATPLQRLQPGDILAVRHGELIPADGLLLKGSARVDYAFVTGESDPVEIKAGERIYAGGKQLGERIEISLTRRTDQSYLTQLWNDEAFKPSRPGAVSLLADQAARFFTWLVLLIAVGCVGYWWGWRGDADTAIDSATAILIVACPCVIALAIPFTLGNLLRILGQNRFYLKNIHVMEGLSQVDAVVLDKTGTLTKVVTDHAADTWTTEPDQAVLSTAEQQAVLTLAQQSSHPKARQLAAVLAETVDAKGLEVVDFQEIIGQGIRGTVGVRQVVIGSASFVFTVDGERPTADGTTAATVRRTPYAVSREGLFVSLDGVVRGHFTPRKKYREGLRQVLNYLTGMRNAESGMRNGLRLETPVYVLSGDTDREAAVLGEFFKPDQLHFGQSPQDKLDFVKRLQHQGRHVLMLGDGLNDAGALRQSDVGIVLTEQTNNFTPACDAILHADAFAHLPRLLEVARSGVRIVQWSYAIALIYNVIGLSYTVTGHISPLVAAILMPASSISIVLFGVGVGNWKARSLRGVTSVISHPE